MNVRLRLDRTFGFDCGRRMVKVVIDQIFMVLHQRHQRRDFLSTFGCITYFGQGYLKVLEGHINAEKYLEVLDECLWPTVHQYFPDGGYIFPEDNAPIHKVNLVKQYFQEKNTAPLPWPAYSPDLSPIENCWSLMKMRLQKDIHLVKSNADLAQRVTSRVGSRFLYAILKLCMKAYLNG